MPSKRAMRPRVLSAIFGVYFLLMAVIAWYSGQTLGYRYSLDVTRWTFTIYLLAGAIFVVGIAAATLWTMKYIDGRIEKLEQAAGPEVELVEELVVEEPVLDAVPPPLHEEPASSGDHVDRDIDELLVSLQEMEQEAVEEVPEVTAVAPRAVQTKTVEAERPVADLVESRRLTILRTKRDSIVSYFAGPALASIAAVGISAAMLPGSDGFLLSHPELNTSLMLGLGYTFVGIAAYVAASILLMTRNK